MQYKYGLKNLIRVIKSPGFWLILGLLILITIPHYREAAQLPSFLTDVMVQLGLNRHAFERIFYLFPIILSGFLFGWQGTVITSFTALACMLPRVILYSPSFTDALFESIAVFVVGNIVAFTFIALKKERNTRVRLAVMDKIATSVSQSLELSQVLNASTDSVMSVMNIDAALIFLVDEEAGELELSSYKGVSATFVQGVEKLKLGEGMNGSVAITGEPEYVEDAVVDKRVTKMEAIRFEGLHSHFIVPLKSKGRVMGTLAIATKDKYQFKKEEMETAMAIGNEIGVAIDNARIYEKEKRIAEQLRVSEERFRNLFENAHDAIWLNDLDDRIIAANKACTRLTGYNLDEFYSLKANQILSGDSLPTGREIREHLLQNRDAGLISEVRLIKKDGGEVIIQLASSLLLSDGQPWAFQHIARDITQEKHMEENLRFYLRQVTQAQEDERKRVARELHDDTIQSLVVLARQIDEISYGGKHVSSEAKKSLENLREETNNIMAGIRRLSQDLRPPTFDRLGLIPALEWLVSNIADISGIPITFNIRGIERKLPIEAEMTLYRIIQEGLRNVWRHSLATGAEVLLEYEENKTRLMIQDNGTGLDFTYPAEDLARYGKLGLAGIRERARLLGGAMEIESKPGEGTVITVEVPV